MRTMDSAVQELLDKGVISGRAAYEKAINKTRFEHVQGHGLNRVRRHPGRSARRMA